MVQSWGGWSRLRLGLLLLGASSCAPFGPVPEDTLPEGEGSNAVFYEDFENGTEACSRWEISGGVALREPAGRDSATSCQVCRTSERDIASLVRRIPLTEAGDYEVSFWLKKVSAVSWSAGVIIAWEGGGTPYTKKGELADDWSLVQFVAIAAPAGTREAEIRIQVEAPADGCMLVDDIALLRVPD
jgi:hypothetical protein